MKFLIRTNQIVFNQTWLVNEVLVWFVWGAEEVGQSPVWVLAVMLTSWKFLILTVYAQQILDSLYFALRIKRHFCQTFTLSFIICLHLFSSVFLYGGMCCIGNPQINVCCPWEVLLPWVLSKYCQELLGRQIIPLRRVRHHSFFFFFFFLSMPLSFKDAAASCLACVCMPLKAERCVWVVRVYVQVCLFLCHLDRVTDTEG